MSSNLFANIILQALKDLGLKPVKGGFKRTKTANWENFNDAYKYISGSEFERHSKLIEIDHKRYRKAILRELE